MKKRGDPDEPTVRLFVPSTKIYAVQETENFNFGFS
jgi:hypothetical protein